MTRRSAKLLVVSVVSFAFIFSERPLKRWKALFESGVNVLKFLDPF